MDLVLIVALGAVIVRRYVLATGTGDRAGELSRKAEGPMAVFQAFSRNRGQEGVIEPGRKLG